MTLSARGRLTVANVPPTHHWLPLHLRSGAQPATPREAGRRPGGCSRGALPGERSPKLLGCEGREATRLHAAQTVGWVPALSPGPSPGYLILAAAPTTLLAAQQLRNGQRRRIRLVRGCSQAHVGAGTVADAQRNRNSAEESAGLAASLDLSCSPAGRDGAAQTNKLRGPALAVTHLSRRPRPPMGALSAVAPRLLGAEGRTLAGQSMPPGEKQPLGTDRTSPKELNPLVPCEFGLPGCEPTVWLEDAACTVGLQ